MIQSKLFISDNREELLGQLAEFMASEFDLVLDPEETGDARTLWLNEGKRCGMKIESKLSGTNVHYFTLNAMRAYTNVDSIYSSTVNSGDMYIGAAAPFSISLHWIKSSYGVLFGYSSATSGISNKRLNFGIVRMLDMTEKIDYRVVCYSSYSSTAPFACVSDRSNTGTRQTSTHTATRASSTIMSLSPLVWYHENLKAIGCYFTNYYGRTSIAVIELEGDRYVITDTSTTYPQFALKLD